MQVAIFASDQRTRVSKVSKVSKVDPVPLFPPTELLQQSRWLPQNDRAGN